MDFVKGFAVIQWFCILSHNTREIHGLWCLSSLRNARGHPVMECSTASALPPHNWHLWSCLGHEPNKSTVMAKHIYGWLNTFIPIMEIGGIRKATDQFQSTFCDHRSYSNAALSTQCWLNPSKDEKWDLGGGLLTQDTGQETPWQMNSVAKKEMQL